MLTGKKVLVIGLARSGKAAVKLLQKLNATITINEGKELEKIEGYQEYLDAGIEIIAGGHPDELFERDFDFVVKNPGINYHKPFILRLKERGIPVYTEIELAYQVAKKQHYIAVTGTNGKTTTVTLIYEILKAQYEHVHFAGNIGKPLCDVVLENNLLEEENHYIVIEMSNFQLLDIDKFRPEISTVINLTPDHLDYMASLDEYYASKTNIYKNTDQNDYFVVNLDDSVLSEYLKKYPDRINVSLADIQNDKEFMAKLQSIDGLIDDEIARKGKEINEKERPNDVYIIDSRLAWSNVPDSYAIRLTVNEAIAGKRVFYDTTRGSEDQYETVDEAIQKTRKRKLGEIERYKEKYGINLLDENNYDLVVDTSYTNTQELADIIVSGEEAYRTGKSYPKYWANPTCAER